MLLLGLLVMLPMGFGQPLSCMSNVYDCKSNTTAFGAGPATVTNTMGGTTTAACASNLTGPPILGTCSNGPPKAPGDASTLCFSKSNSNATIQISFQTPLYGYSLGVYIVDCQAGFISGDVWVQTVGGATVKVPCNPDLSSGDSAFWWTCTLPTPYLYIAGMTFMVTGTGEKPPLPIFTPFTLPSEYVNATDPVGILTVSRQVLINGSELTNSSALNYFFPQATSVQLVAVVLGIPLVLAFGELASGGAASQQITCDSPFVSGNTPSVIPSGVSVCGVSAVKQISVATKRSSEDGMPTPTAAAASSTSGSSSSGVPTVLIAAVAAGGVAAAVSLGIAGVVVRRRRRLRVARIEAERARQQATVLTEAQLARVLAWQQAAEAAVLADGPPSPPSPVGSCASTTTPFASMAAAVAEPQLAQSPSLLRRLTAAAVPLVIPASPYAQQHQQQRPRMRAASMPDADAGMLGSRLAREAPSEAVMDMKMYDVDNDEDAFYHGRSAATVAAADGESVPGEVYSVPHVALLPQPWRFSRGSNRTAGSMGSNGGITIGVVRGVNRGTDASDAGPVVGRLGQVPPPRASLPATTAPPMQLNQSVFSAAAAAAAAVSGVGGAATGAVAPPGGQRATTPGGGSSGGAAEAAQQLLALDWAVEDFEMGKEETQGGRAVTDAPVGIPRRSMQRQTQPQAQVQARRGGSPSSRLASSSSAVDAQLARGVL
eukprot:XP_001701495.1 predicted protein [Chlamydomonas reinhardtii]